jgi:hypothetical protein
MPNKLSKTIVFLIVFLFSLIGCSKKQDVNMVAQINNEEMLTNESNIENDYIMYYSDNHKKFIENLLLEHNKKEPDNVLDASFYFGGTLDYLSLIKFDIDITKGETWLSSWIIPDSASMTYNWLYLHIIKDDSIETHRMPISPEISAFFYWNEYNFIQFPILKNIPGHFYPRYSEMPGVWLYDVNEDGFDEIIWTDPAGVGSDKPKVYLKILGYDKDEFVFYLEIQTTTIDKETGPEPIQFIQNLGVWGFRCLVDSSDYTPMYGLPAMEDENLIWVFFTWDTDERKYIEREFIVE